MARSPLEASVAEGDKEYFDNWRALGAMINRGKSFSGRERNRAFLNLGGASQRWADASGATGFDLPDDSRALLTVDWDHDGDLDIWLTNRTAPQVRFLRNDFPASGFVALRLRGKTCNRDGIGARVEIELADKRKLVRTSRAGESFLSQSGKWLHFGLGGETKLGRVTVRWPGGPAETFTGVEPGGRYLLAQGSGQALRQEPPGVASALRPGPPNLPKSTEQARVVLTSRKPVPHLPYVDFSGREKEWKPDGQAYLIVLWATWCPPCLAELEALAKHADALKRLGVQVLPLNVDAISDDPKAGLAKAKQFGKRLPFPEAATEETVTRVLTQLHHLVISRERSLPLPSGFLVDGQGMLAVIYKGPVEAEQVLKDAVLVAPGAKASDAAAFPFPGKMGLNQFDLSPLGFAKAYLAGGWVEDARRAAEESLARFGSLKPGQNVDKGRQAVEAFLTKLPRAER